MKSANEIKILYLTDSSKFNSGGIRQLVYNLKGFKEMNVKTALVCREGSDVAEMAKDLCEVFTADFSKPRKAGKMITAIIESYKPDIIHSYHNKAHKAAVWAKILSGTKAKLYVNRGVVAAPGNLLYYLNPYVDGFTCNSMEGINVLHSRMVSRKKLFLIHNGIDPELFSVKPKPDGVPKVVYIGNNAKLKGFDLFEKAVNSLPGDLNFKAMAIGLNEQYENGRMISVGKQRNVQEFLFEGDIFVLSSRAKFESFPNVLIEAMACGMAAISFDVGAVSEIIEEGVNGFVIDRDNTGKMAEKIEYLLRNPERCLEMGIRNRQDVVRRFSYHIKCENLLKLYLGEMNSK